MTKTKAPESLRGAVEVDEDGEVVVPDKAAAAHVLDDDDVDALIAKREAEEAQD